MNENKFVSFNLLKNTYLCRVYKESSTTEYLKNIDNAEIYNTKEKAYKVLSQLNYAVQKQFQVLSYKEALALNTPKLYI